MSPTIPHLMSHPIPHPSYTLNTPYSTHHIPHHISYPILHPLTYRSMISHPLDRILSHMTHKCSLPHYRINRRYPYILLTKNRNIELLCWNIYYYICLCCIYTTRHWSEKYLYASRTSWNFVLCISSDKLTFLII